MTHIFEGLCMNLHVCINKEKKKRKEKKDCGLMTLHVCINKEANY